MRMPPPSTTSPTIGLLDPDVRAAWADLILPLLRLRHRRSVLDVGCGQAASVLLGQAGYDVHGIDFSERMVAAAREKAERGVEVAVRGQVTPRRRL